MNTPASVFDNSMEQWIKENNLPWMKLKTDLGLNNLKKHLPGKPLRILDAGGGSGYDSTCRWLGKGIGSSLSITPKRCSRPPAPMRNARDCQTACGFHRADVKDVNRLFPQPAFDAIVCHNVIQYVSDAQQLISGLSAVLVPGGILSLIGGNRLTMPYRAAFFLKDLDEALQQIGARLAQSWIFSTNMTEYSVEEIRGMLPGAGLSFVSHYGIRCFADYWGDNETKSRPEVWEKISKLEYALTDKEPYNLLARFWQVIARRP